MSTLHSGLVSNCSLPVKYIVHVLPLFLLHTLSDPIQSGQAIEPEVTIIRKEDQLIRSTASMGLCIW